MPMGGWNKVLRIWAPTCHMLLVPFSVPSGNPHSLCALGVTTLIQGENTRLPCEGLERTASLTMEEREMQANYRLQLPQPQNLFFPLHQALGKSLYVTAFLLSTVVPWCSCAMQSSKCLLTSQTTEQLWARALYLHPAVVWWTMWGTVQRRVF